MALARRPQLRRWLEAGGCRDPEDLERLARAAQPGRSWVGEVLAHGLAKETAFFKEIARDMHWSFADLDTVAIDREALGALPSRLVFLHLMLPIGRTEGRLQVATCDPFNSIGQQLARDAAGSPVQWVVATHSQLVRKIKDLYGVGAETFDEILENRAVSDALDDQFEATDLDEEASDASVVKFVNQIIREAIRERATDIHVEPQERSLRIRYRIDGMLSEAAVPPKLRLLQSAIITRLKIMAKMDIAEHRLPQDGRINLQSAEGNWDVRVSTVPSVNGESISLRLLNQNEEQQYALGRLGLDGAHESTIRELLQQPNGIVLVTGPTGSGKSTSLYSFLSEINAVERRIITVEEPVEYRLPGVTQIEVKPEIDLTFANVLRSILRQDPNIIMVGEVRDVETAEIAIRAAMTGHLVFSTLHTNDAVSGITRLIDMGVEPFLLASVVRAILAQRLVRRVCPHCAELRQYPEEELRKIRFPVEQYGTQFYVGQGCEKCRDSGYLGRCAIYEVVQIDDRLHQLIVGKSASSVLRQTALDHGMRTLRQDGWRRVAASQTTIEEVLRITAMDAE